MPVPYAASGLGGPGSASDDLVRALQRDLRALGYLARGIDGRFGPHTSEAVRRLQWDLLHNDGASTRNDGPAPVPLRGYDRGIAGITGVVDGATAASIEAMLSDPAFLKLPRSDDPAAANRKAVATVGAIISKIAPPPFLAAIFRQESDFSHFAVPNAGDTDDFVVVGVDIDKAIPDRIASRGYGVGQYTLFHHPPRAQEVTDFIVDPAGNAAMALHVLREKFDGFIVGHGPGEAALDRTAEHPLLSLRTCRFNPADPRYMSGCRDCAGEVPSLRIDAATPLYQGAAETYGDAPHYRYPLYAGVPDRAGFLCDWPYAARRYNGDGPDSYNYQARILLNLLRSRDPAGAVA